MTIGAPLVYYSGHRNPSVLSGTTDGVLVDTCVHDIDVSRCLFDSEVTAVQVFSPRRSSHANEGLQDPVLVHLELANEMLVVDRGRGERRLRLRHPRRGARRDRHDRAGRVQPDRGQARAASTAGRVPADWRERFIRAYDIEFQEWIDAVAAGHSTGPSSWDGYAAAVVTDACVEAFRTGQRRPPVSLPEQAGPLRGRA